MKIALFPGSFDPVTKAHVDIVKRSIGLFDKVYIGIGVNTSKTGLLSVETREKMLRAVFENEPKIHIVIKNTLTANAKSFCFIAMMFSSSSAKEITTTISSGHACYWPLGRPSPTAVAVGLLTLVHASS